MTRCWHLVRDKRTGTTHRCYNKAVSVYRREVDIDWELQVLRETPLCGQHAAKYRGSPHLQPLPLGSPDPRRGRAGT